MLRQILQRVDASLSINFVMLSLILAVVYNSYAESLKEYVLDSFRNRAKGLKAAFLRMRAANLRQNAESSGVCGTQIAQLLEQARALEGGCDHAVRINDDVQLRFPWWAKPRGP